MESLLYLRIYFCVLVNEQRKPFVLSFARLMRGIFAAEVASEPLKKETESTGPFEVKAGWADWNHDQPVAVSRLFYLRQEVARAQSFPSSPRGAF